jgi:hypothetical protein
MLTLPHTCSGLASTVCILTRAIVTGALNNYGIHHCEVTLSI